MGTRNKRLRHERLRALSDEQITQGILDLLEAGVFERAGGPTELSAEDYVRGNYPLRVAKKKEET